MSTTWSKLHNLLQTSWARPLRQESATQGKTSDPRDPVPVHQRQKKSLKEHNGCIWKMCQGQASSTTPWASYKILKPLNTFQNKENLFYSTKRFLKDGADLENLLVSQTLCLIKNDALVAEEVFGHSWSPPSKNITEILIDFRRRKSDEDGHWAPVHLDDLLAFWWLTHLSA